MNLTHSLRASALLFACSLAAASAFADTVETKNGSKLVGTITKIDGGDVYLKTDYAGDLVIKQADAQLPQRRGDRHLEGRVVQRPVVAEVVERGDE